MDWWEIVETRDVGYLWFSDEFNAQYSQVMKVRKHTMKQRHPTTVEPRLSGPLFIRNLNYPAL